jgi:hypothetical protein
VGQSPARDEVPALPDRYFHCGTGACQGPLDFVLFVCKKRDKGYKVERRRPARRFGGAVAPRSGRSFW